MCVQPWVFCIFVNYYLVFYFLFSCFLFLPATAISLYIKATVQQFPMGDEGRTYNDYYYYLCLTAFSSPL